MVFRKLFFFALCATSHSLIIPITHARQRLTLPFQNHGHKDVMKMKMAVTEENEVTPTQNSDTFNQKDSSSQKNEVLDTNSESDSEQSIFERWFFPFEIELISALDAAKQTRLLSYRSYARRDAFRQENIAKQPSLKDVTPETSSNLDRIWISSVFRSFVLVSSFLSFPFLTKTLYEFVSISPEQLNDITSLFGPGVSILYGTFISLTLSILYERQKKIQENVSVESALISLLARDLLTVFKNDQDKAVESIQCIADQIRILVNRSRGEELMCLIYSDPYYRILEIVAEKEEALVKNKSKNKNDIGALQASLSSTRDNIKDAITIRSRRLSDEALALPPTHYYILVTLTFLIMFGFTVSALPDVANDGAPSNESSILFAILNTIYVAFFNFANDLNNPFRGVYQIRRSSTAANLLQTKFLIANHPILKGMVDFEAGRGSGLGEGKTSVWTPGLGYVQIEDYDAIMMNKK